jgi:hypothetical protein
MTTLEIVVFVVTALALAACLTPSFSVRRAVSGLGRQGTFWFEHEGDRELADRASDDERDAPLPRRPLRARH